MLNFIHPYIIAFIAVFGYATMGAIAKKTLPDLPPLPFVVLSNVFIFIFALILTQIFVKDFSFSDMDTKAWIGVMVFSAINIIAFGGYLFALQFIPLVEYQLIAVCIPIIGGLLGFFFLGEPIKIQYIIGFVFVAIGLYIALKV